MNQVYQNRQYDSQNAFLQVVDVPDTRTRNYHMNALCQDQNWGQKSGYKFLDPNLIYVGGRGTLHGVGTTVLYALREPPAPLKLDGLFADLEASPLTGDIPARSVEFSVWDCMFGDGPTLYVVAAQGQPGYAVFTAQEIQEALADREEPETPNKTYDAFLAKLNSELLTTKNVSTAEGN